MITLFIGMIVRKIGGWSHLAGPVQFGGHKTPTESQLFIQNVIINAHNDATYIRVGKFIIF